MSAGKSSLNLWTSIPRRCSAVGRRSYRPLIQRLSGPAPCAVQRSQDADHQRQHCERGDHPQLSYWRAPDGVQLTWSKVGSGPPLVKAANWMNHLEYAWESPVRDPAWRRYSPQRLDSWCDWPRSERTPPLAPTRWPASQACVSPVAELQVLNRRCSGVLEGSGAPKGQATAVDATIWLSHPRSVQRRFLEIIECLSQARNSLAGLPPKVYAFRPA